MATLHFYIKPPFQVYPPFPAKKLYLHPSDQIFGRSYAPFDGQVDSPELPEMLEITEITENFRKVTKYLTKFKKEH